MLSMPNDIAGQYNNILQQRAIPEVFRAHYRKWLRYFLDFCLKYPPPEERSEQVRLFIAKLRSKKQTPQQCTQAAHAVSLYFESQPLKKTSHSVTVKPLSSTAPLRPILRPAQTQAAKGAFADGGGISAMTETAVAEPSPPQSLMTRRGGKRYNEWHCLEQTKSSAWDQAIDKLAAEITIRHYSRKTLKTYADWGRKFQRYLRDKPPDELSAVDVKEYLTYLAVKCRVASSTQNQAFNALLFLFRHVLEKEFGDQRDVPRAKKSKYIPVVLSRPEIDAVTKHLDYPFDIVVKLLYGCGLRLFECLRLRVKNFNFEDGILTVHGKGDKDRTVPIPQTIMPELKRQLEAVSALFDKDIESGYSGVFLFDSLEKKYPSAAKDFIWQWFFPQK